MTTVFIAGSINIKNLDRKVKERIDRVIDQKLDIVVGDADGADTSIQNHLFLKGADQVTVFCSGTTARNNIGDWPETNVEPRFAPGTRAFFTAKDIEMAKVADYGFMVWDAKSTGTLSNVIELLNRKKKSVVFVNKEKDFKTIGNIEQLIELIACMSGHAKIKAEEKIRLSEKIDALRQTPMFA